MLGSNAKSLVVLRLYKSLLKTSKYFDDPNNGPVISSFIHRTGMGDDMWVDLLRSEAVREETNDTRRDGGIGEDTRIQPEHIFFRKILREYLGGSMGCRRMQFPSHATTVHLGSLIRREFKMVESPHSADTRRQVAFIALREMNKKLAWMEILKQKASVAHPMQPARLVFPLPIDPKQYLRPGAYLIAHPHLDGYFRRTVICLLEHHDGESGSSFMGSYGLIVNRVCTSPQTGRNLTLEETVRPLPSTLLSSFGGCPVREGGPVNLALQMMHTIASPLDDTGVDLGGIGGTPLPWIEGTVDESSALYSDRAIYFHGDVLKAAEAVTAGRIDRDDVAFFVGACTWSVGQLERYVWPCSESHRTGELTGLFISKGKSSLRFLIQ